MPTNGSAGSGGAPTNATYLTLTPDATLSNEQALSALASGILVNTAGVISAATSADLPSHTHTATAITSGTLAVAYGGTGSDLSATGGSNQVVKQSTLGGALTVAALTSADLPSHTHASIANIQLTYDQSRRAGLSHVVEIKTVPVEGWQPSTETAK